MRIWQIGLALCLMASLLAASGSACACSHHEDVKAAETCSSHHEMHNGGEQAATDVSDAVKGGCICASPQPYPWIASRSETKKLVGDLDVAGVSHDGEPRLIAEILSNPGSRFFEFNKPFSANFRAHLRPRAPPLL